MFNNKILSKKELVLVKKLIEVSNKKKLFGTEEQLFNKLRRLEHLIS